MYLFPRCTDSDEKKMRRNETENEIKRNCQAMLAERVNARVTTREGKRKMDE